jgi:hypothetical protein
MSVDRKDFAHPEVLSGSFTSAASPVAVSEVLPWKPSLVICFINVEGTNPNMHIANAVSTTDAIQVTGSSGVWTSPSPSASVALTSTGFTVAASAQVANGKNVWIAFK